MLCIALLDGGQKSTRLGGTGRSSRMSVATSPGMMLVQRIPFSYSCPLAHPPAHHSATYWHTRIVHKAIQGVSKSKVECARV
jgi:hypothetical protein